MKLPAHPTYRPSGVEWLGDVPVHWDVKRGRFCMDVNPRSNRLRTLRDEDEVSFVPMEAVGEYGGMNLEQTRAISDVGSGYTEFDDGDVVVAKITPCFENGKGALAAGLVNGAAFGTTELHVLRSASNLERRFLFYFTISRLFRSTGEGEMYGAGGQKRVPPEFCENVQLPLPLADEQRAIADFLDRETAKIDTLVAKKRTLIERLKEKRTALISRAVTRGLPPDAARAAGFDPHPKLKTSGIDFFGEIPHDWRVSRVWLERVAQSLEYQDGNHGEIHPKASDYVSDGVPFVMANHIVNGQIDLSTCNYIEPELAASLRVGFAVAGDVLLTHKGTIGRVGMVQPNDHDYVMLTPQVTYYRCLRGIDGRFVFWFFQAHAWQEQMGLASSLGTTRAYVGLLDQRFLALLLPPADLQRAIANYLDTEAEKIDSLLARIDTAVERLGEYRTALITAAVTGKIDVRGAVA